VQDELVWEPRIDETKIGVAVDDGVETLSGKVHSIKEKEEAERASLRAPGVFKIVNNLKVQYYPAYA